MRALVAMFTVSLALTTDPGGAAAASGPLAGPFDSSPIVGGVPTDEGEFDAVAALTIDGGQCSGTLVDPRFILTAGHCFDADRSDQEVYVSFGTDPDGPSVAAKGYGIHPNYCPFCGEMLGSEYVERYDFAYVELSEPYAPADGILLPVTSQEDWDDTMKVGSTLTLVGYGKTEPLGGASSPGRAKHMVTTVIEEFSDRGIEFFAGQDEVTRDTCNGDSGGPALVRNRDGELRLAGVTSRGSNPCGDGGWYGVPYAALVWLDNQTDTELLPAGCEYGDCLDLVPPDDPAVQCAVGHDRGRGGAWLLPGLLLGLRRRRRAPGQSPR